MSFEDIKRTYEDRVKCIDRITGILTYCDSLIAIGGLYLIFRKSKIANIDVLKSMEQSIDGILEDLLTDIEKLADVCNQRERIDKIIKDIDEGLAIGEVVKYENVLDIFLNIKAFFNGALLSIVKRIKDDTLHFLELYLKSYKINL